jgi:hypothetical protein
MGLVCFELSIGLHFVRIREEACSATNMQAHRFSWDMKRQMSTNWLRFETVIHFISSSTFI